MMDLVEFWLGYWDSYLAFLAFGLFHSICAREPFKEKLAGITGQFFVDHFWRIIYCAISYIMLYWWIMYLHFYGHPEGGDLYFENIYIVNAMMILRLFSVIVLYLAFIRSDYLQFLGIKQFYKGMRQILTGKKQPREELFGTDVLETDGIYSWVRHPMLAAGWLFVATLPTSQNSIVLLAMYTAYMFIGGHYEEERMLRVFGKQYEDYQKQVGAYFPRLTRFIRKPVVQTAV